MSCPAPIEDYTTSRVLTMEYVSGTKITTLSPVALLEVNGAALAEQLFRAYLKQILVDGFFHADPHPGNVLVTDAGQIALLDLGMVGRIAPRLQEPLLQLLLAISEGHSDDAVRFALKVGEVRPDFDEPEFSRRVADLVGRHQDAELRNMQVGKAVLEIGRISGDVGLRLPSELTMLGKTLLNLDQIAEALDPTFNPNASIRQQRRRDHAGPSAQERLSREHVRRHSRAEGVHGATAGAREQDPRHGGEQPARGQGRRDRRGPPHGGISEGGEPDHARSRCWPR